MLTSCNIHIRIERAADKSLRLRPASPASHFSYGLLFGVGNAMVRETSAVMLSQYFKRRRELVEVVASAGTGVGVAVFTNVFHLGIG